MADDEPLLDLNTLVRRETIAVDDKRYELFSIDELSVLASHRFTLWARRLEQLGASDDDADTASFAELVDKVAMAALVDMPAAVFETLSGADKIAITDVFTALLLRPRLRAAGAIGRAMGGPSIGATSSPGSSDIMAATRDGGWLKRLGRWFGLI